jgi:hypothetical protein
MKKAINIFGIIIVCLMILVMFSNCGGPRSLARESVNLVRQAERAATEGNVQRLIELDRRRTDHLRKVESLSQSDREIYFREVVRLMAGN